MVALRLFVPESWTSNPVRLKRAGVPVEHRAARTKPEIALAEIDRVIASGVSSAKFCFLMQMSTKLCRTLHRFAEGILVTNGSIGGGDGRLAEAVGHSCKSVPKRFRAFRSIL
jgi:hypothetical protein